MEETPVDATTITTLSLTLVSVQTVITTLNLEGLTILKFTTTADVTSFITITSTLPVKHLPNVAQSLPTPRKPTSISIIVGSIFGSLVLVILILIGVVFYRKRVLEKGSHTGNTKNAKHQPAEINDPQNIGSLLVAHTRSHSETRPTSGSSVRYSESLHDSARDQSVIGSTSTATVRQMQLQEEADDLRQQVRQLQQAVDTSNDDMQGMQVAMRRMMEHILSLESQLNSDWARGLTDEPPPMYGEI
ncbi:hypothetical protein K435DRAFT_800250 [Dendrothele bispora CBS 962.96]|uniref:Mid2 domain-containing protein n=1 Tax=Dendrothele bispora (strain CBS 962.96) TaxID=1314807 RepID=A0A4S8LTP9_DENBC|nr:hypothetical protein K435DRAFT_800250 [Dendrothele bispora CBS 962.96]